MRSAAMPWWSAGLCAALLALAVPAVSSAGIEDEAMATEDEAQTSGMSVDEEEAELNAAAIASATGGAVSAAEQRASGRDAGGDGTEVQEEAGAEVE